MTTREQRLRALEAKRKRPTTTSAMDMSISELVALLTRANDDQSLTEAESRQLEELNDSLRWIPDAELEELVANREAGHMDVKREAEVMRSALDRRASGEPEIFC